ncbi:MAG: acyl-CoA dehydratase activase-related protein [Candidatus Cryptobacteroides sp.]
MYKIGLDLGSTTIKAVVLNDDGNILFHKYKRHNAKIYEVLSDVLDEIVCFLGKEVDASVAITGSVGMGIAEKCGIPFVQEVVAATKSIAHKRLRVKTMIDIGGEDAKVVFFNDDGATETLRMNGNCSGGTGAFIDQMAIILGEDIDKLSVLAEKSTKTYPIASRCGVFCKTDIQNLIAKGVGKEDIAASIFRAVVVQTVVTLAHGCEIKPPVLLCGGPLTYIPSLRKSFREYLGLSEEDFILPEDGSLLPALGTAVGHSPVYGNLMEIVEGIKTRLNVAEIKTNTLRPLFISEEDHQQWSRRVLKNRMVKGDLTEGYKEAFLGIDSGSTTTKVVVIDREGKILFHHYSPNRGQSVAEVRNALKTLADKCIENGTMLNIVSACSTGYGEDLIKAAFGIDFGIIETVAHFIAAKQIDPQVSFILDIGGQDMKAMYVSEGVINRIEINEACSSGCGSFLETFARSTGLTVSEFAEAACRAKYPCDLGTRCTVFMNSKVKQVLREGYSAEDIAAGLAYSVIKNCLYKVLKVNDISSLGKHIVVQGGTMKNDAVVKALEIMTGAQVSRSDMPELMGAFGCALYALEHCPADINIERCRLPEHLVANAAFTSKTINCRGCENNCLVTAYRFKGERNYYSGNRCERIFCNSGESKNKGRNIYEYKYQRVFRTLETDGRASLKIGIPRCLNIYEDFPFWQRLFVECGFEVVISDDSDYGNYERNAGMVMSDNLCFPAKLVHSHISNLVEKKVDRIFFPFVIHSRQNGGENSYNCPIVTGYTEVVRNVQKTSIPIDSFTFSMKDRRLFRKQCCIYLESLGVNEQTGGKAFDLAMQEILEYESQMAKKADDILASSRKEGKMTIMLVGRPYHSDPIIQHNVADMIASLGVNVISEDIVRKREGKLLSKVNFVSQWSYTNRILQAAKWCADQANDVQFVQMTSFGCGPDAFLTDAVRDILMERGKSLTLLKLDDINNVGSMKLRVRSLVDTMLLLHSGTSRLEERQTPPVYEKKHRNRKILIPFFTPFISPLIPALMKPLGYDVESLPISDERSAEYGLKYVNNEVCYPAILIVGDFIKAFKEGGYDPSSCAVAMTQTGGQCRASNYLPMIKKAIVDAGYTDTPVISVAFGSGLENEQPGFKVNWLKVIPCVLYSLLFADSIAKMYYACAAREKEKGIALTLKDRYLADGAALLEKGQWKRLLELTGRAATEFNDATADKDTDKVGVVGEIYLKFNPFAHKHVVDWLISRGVEIVPPMLTDFFSQFFVNRKVKKASLSEDSRIPDWIYNYMYRLYKKHMSYFNKAGAGFRYWSGFNDIFQEAKEAESIINLNVQFGEGWLLPAEIATYYKSGVKNVISLQPFGCIANHIVVRGVEKRLKELFPRLNLLSLDFDSGVSDVNVTNRMLLFIDNLG